MIAEIGHRPTRILCRDLLRKALSLPAVPPTFLAKPQYTVPDSPRHCLHSSILYLMLVDRINRLRSEIERDLDRSCIFSTMPQNQPSWPCNSNRQCLRGLLPARNTNFCGLKTTDATAKEGRPLYRVRIWAPVSHEYPSMS